MFKKTLFSLLLTSALCTNVMAKSIPACVIDQDQQQDLFLQLSTCELSMQTMLQIEKYFNTRTSVFGLVLTNVKMNAQAANALMEILVNHNTINMLLVFDSKMDNVALAKLSQNSWIQVLSLENTGIDENTLAKISENNSISVLILNEKKLSAKSVGEFLDKHPLTYLSLAGVDNNGLQELAKHSNFSGLGLLQTTATDFTPLKSLPQLTDLMITGTTINHDSALAISELKNLSYLVLSDVTLQPSDTNLMLINLNELAYLDISHYDPALTNTNVDGNTAMIINGLPQLINVNLAHQAISDSAAFIFSMNSHLNMLGLSGNNIQDIGGYSLAQNQSITFLDISDNQLSDPTAYAFAENTILKNLFISGNHFSYAAIDALKNNKHIEYLSIDDDRDESQKVKVGSHDREVNYVIKKFMKTRK